MRWRWLWQTDPCEPALGVALEAAIMESVGSAQAPPTLRVWSGAPALVLGRAETGLKGLAGGLAWAQNAGLAVVRRHSGGQAVLHGPGYLNISLTAPSPSLGDLARDYKNLCAPLIAGLGRLGVATAFGEVRHSFCAGPYDLVAADGRKLVGVAQARRTGAVLVHGTLLLNPDLDALAATITAFYQAAGLPERAVARATLTSVAQIAGAGVTAAAIAQAVAAACPGRAAPAVAQPLPAEQARALALAGELRLV